MAEDSESRIPELSDAHLREIGQVAVMFNRLEAVLRLIIYELLGGDEGTRDVAVHGDSFPALLRKVERLVEIRIQDKELKAEIADWRRSALRANELRRETIHSSWITLGEGEEALALLYSRTGGSRRGGLLSAKEIGYRARAIAAVGVWGLHLLRQMEEAQRQGDN